MAKHIPSEVDGLTLCGRRFGGPTFITIELAEPDLRIDDPSICRQCVRLARFRIARKLRVQVPKVLLVCVALLFGCGGPEFTSGGDAATGGTSTTLEATGGTTPAATGGTATGGTATTLEATGGTSTTLEATGGATPAATGGTSTTLEATGGATPAATGGTSTQATGGKPAATGGTSTQATGGKPAATGGTSTQATGGTSAASTTDPGRCPCAYTGQCSPRYAACWTSEPGNPYTCVKSPLMCGSTATTSGSLYCFEC